MCLNLWPDFEGLASRRFTKLDQVNEKYKTNLLLLYIMTSLNDKIPLETFGFMELQGQWWCSYITDRKSYFHWPNFTCNPFDENMLHVNFNRRMHYFHGGCLLVTTWNMSKYGVFSGPYFSVFGLNTEVYLGKYGPEKTPNLDTWRIVWYQSIKILKTTENVVIAVKVF